MKSRRENCVKKEKQNGKLARETIYRDNTKLSECKQEKKVREKDKVEPKDKLK